MDLALSQAQSCRFLGFRFELSSWNGIEVANVSALVLFARSSTNLTVRNFMERSLTTVMLCPLSRALVRRKPKKFGKVFILKSPIP